MVSRFVEVPVVILPWMRVPREVSACHNWFMVRSAYLTGGGGCGSDIRQKGISMKQVIVLALASMLAASAFAGGNGSFNDKKDNFNPTAFDHANEHGLMNSNPNSALSPVPEADTVAMLVAGVGVVGLVVARRRKK